MKTNTPPMPSMHGKTANKHGIITEFPLNWPGKLTASTHELVIDEDYIYVTGQNMHQIAKFNYKGELIGFYPMPAGSGPHGILLDARGRLWVSLEFIGKVVRLDETGQIVEEIDVNIEGKINPAPHGIGLDADGETIWFTGKRTSTLGRINPDRSIDHFQLNNLASLPIFLSAGPDGGIWGTELLGNAILHMTRAGTLHEYPIPTPNSRPIAIIPDPSAPCMWFTQEAGTKIGRIDMKGNITEFNIPLLQKNDIAASCCFDRHGNLWAQIYVDTNNPNPMGNDYIIRFDKSIRDLKTGDLSGIGFTTYTTPSRMTMMHRIRMDHDGDLWFTEMMTDKLGRIDVK